jgi:uncharacterized protein
MTLSRIHILSYAFIVCICLYITENIYHPVYLVSLLQKVWSFVLLPILMGYIWTQQITKMGAMNKSSVIYGIGFGILSMIVITITYLLLRDIIDWSAIRSSMESRHITESTFILVFLYIMFGNSFIEEYFFRGQVFYNLASSTRLWAYVTSALMFSLYHITIFGTWFSGWILILALFGLICGGVFFAWLYEQTRGIWWAWIFHIFADFAILAIWYIEFFS